MNELYGYQEEWEIEENPLAKESYRQFHSCGGNCWHAIWYGCRYKSKSNIQKFVSVPLDDLKNLLRFSNMPHKVREMLDGAEYSMYVASICRLRELLINYQLK